MEVKAWTYEEFPEFTEPVEGAHFVETTGEEPGVLYLNDVEYRTTGDTPLRLQLLIPQCRNRRFDRPTDEPAPALPCVVFVQGSAWMQQRIYGNVANISRLAIRGFVCAIVEYRHSGIASFPAQAVDARNAVRFLKQNAASFWIDPEKVILAGDSSGGHTAMWGGLLQNDETEFNHYPGISASVKGIVDYYGSTSLMAPDSNPMTVNHCRPDSPEGMVMGGRDLIEHPEWAEALSVECHIDESTKLPPVLIFHGTKDRVVNCTGSVILYRRLRETNHPVELYLVKGADHGGPDFWTDRVLDIVEDFIRKCVE
ncbi:MAG: alpha/beta hydrolase [Firmicutes bacterium]|nr:alpha/beta hydrolase [Bacillota bacterium]